MCVCVCVCVCVLFGPVKPELGGIPPGQKNIQQWTFKFSWYRVIISLRKKKNKTGYIRIIDLFPSYYLYFW